MNTISARGRHSVALPILLLYLTVVPHLRADESKIEETAHVQAAVEEFLRAVYANDPETVIRHTHEKVIHLMGGRETALSITRQSLSKVASLNMTIERLEFPADPRFIHTSSTEFVLVPTKMIIGSDGKRIESLNYQFGARTLGNSKWKFIEGSRITRANVGGLFPEFPDDQELPATYRKLIED